VLDEGYNGEYFSAVMLNDGTGRFSGPVVTDAGINILDSWLGDFRLGDFRRRVILILWDWVSGAYSVVEFHLLHAR